MKCGRNEDAAVWRQRKIGRIGRSHPAESGVGWGNPSSGCPRFSVFWEEDLDLVCGEAAVGELLQVVGEIASDVEACALGAGEHGHDGCDGRAVPLGA